MSQIVKIERMFDLKLLAASPEERLKAFETKILGHPHLSRASQNLDEEMKFAPVGSIMLLTGPVGSGVTTVARAFYRNFVLSQREQVAADPGLIPIVGANAPPPNPQTGQIAWPTLLNDIQSKLGVNLAGDRMYTPPEQFLLTCGPMVPLPKTSLPGQIRIASRLLGERNTKVVLINHAENLFDPFNPKSIRPTLQSLCELLRDNGAKLVLCGGYSLVNVGQESGEWLYRSTPIHLRRYDIGKPEEHRAFASTVVGLLNQFPAKLAFHGLAEEDITQFHLLSVGCIGHVKTMLYNALARAVHHPEVSVSLDFIWSFSLPGKHLIQLTEEAKHGEETLTDVGLDEVRKALDQTSTAIRPPKKSCQGNPIHRARMGERSPVRDLVGMQS